MSTRFGKIFAEQIKPLVDKANEDINFRKELLADPQKVLLAHQINCPDKITVEYNPGYGIYLAIEQINKVPQPDTPTVNETFNDTHFMDCHQY